MENCVIENNILKNKGDAYDWKTYNIGKILLDRFNSSPEHVAQIEADTEKQTTFAEMKDYSVRCGIWLKAEGIGCGDIVTICSPINMDLYIPVLATFYIGATVNSWNDDIILESAQRLMKSLQPKILFSCEKTVDVLSEAAKLENVNTRMIVIGKHATLQSLQDIILLPSREEVQAFIPQDIENPHEAVAVIFLTSGSTGIPKNVMHSYKSTLNFTQVSPEIEKNVALYYSKPFWISNMIQTLRSILAYQTKILHADFDIEETCRVIEKYKVQRLFISALHITYLSKSNVLQKYNLKSLKSITTGGIKLYQKQLMTFTMLLPHVKVYTCYGMTETGRVIARKTEKNKNLNSEGFILPGNEIKITDLNSGKALGPNETGEVCVKLPTMMLGYYKNPELTKKTIDEDGWLHTGDRGYYNQDGEVFFVDRLKDVIKYQIYQVSPTEIQELLLSHPDIIEAAVVPIPHKLDREHPIAYVRKLPASTVTEEELIELTSNLGEQKKLRGGIKFLDELPKNATRKISRLRLIEMAKELVQSNSY